MSSKLKGWALELLNQEEVFLLTLGLMNLHFSKLQLSLIVILPY